jgi:6-phosphofructokinase 1
MKSLPDFLKGMTFPTSQSTKSGVTTTITDVTSHVTKNLERLKLNHLIAIGGDDTLSYAAKLDKLGVKVIAVPKGVFVRPWLSPSSKSKIVPRSFRTN